MGKFTFSYTTVIALALSSADFLQLSEISYNCYNCHLQISYNSLKQLAASLWMTTCNRLVVNKLSQAMRTRLVSLLQVVNRLVVVASFFGCVVPMCFNQRLWSTFETISWLTMIVYREIDYYIFKLRSFTCLKAVGRLPAMFNFSQEPLGFSRTSFKDDCLLSDIMYAAFCWNCEMFSLLTFRTLSTFNWRLKRWNS